MLPVQLSDDLTAGKAAQPPGVPPAPGLIGLRCENPPKASELTTWEQNMYNLDIKVAASLGFSFGTVSGSARQRVLISEFARSATCAAPDGTELNYGVAVRLAVHVSKYDAGANLGLPFVAAQTQMGRMETKSTLVVRGYSGLELVKLLPKLESFSVERYVELMQTVSKIRELISTDEANIKPGLLAVPESAVEGDPIDYAVGVVWALSKIADAKSRTAAKSDFPRTNAPVAIAAIEDMYAEIVGTDTAANMPPGSAEQKRAQARLGKLRLRTPRLIG